jgi:hypothetical protein
MTVFPFVNGITICLIIVMSAFDQTRFAYSTGLNTFAASSNELEHLPIGKGDLHTI